MVWMLMHKTSELVHSVAGWFWRKASILQAQQQQQQLGAACACRKQQGSLHQTLTSAQTATFSLPIQAVIISLHPWPLASAAHVMPATKALCLWANVPGNAKPGSFRRAGPTPAPLGDDNTGDLCSMALQQAHLAACLQVPGTGQLVP